MIVGSHTGERADATVERQAVQRLQPELLDGTVPGTRARSGSHGSRCLSGCLAVSGELRGGGGVEIRLGVKEVYCWESFLGRVREFGLVDPNKGRVVRLA